MLSEKGFAPVIILISVIVILGGVIGGSVLLRNQQQNLSTNESRLTEKEVLSTASPTPKKLLDESQFTEVSIGQLIKNPQHYYGKGVSVTARFVGKAQPGICLENMDFSPPQFLEEYEPFLSWQIWSPEGSVAVLFMGDDIENPKQIPNYKYWQMINVKGFVMGTSQKSCNAIYKSFYIRTEPEYITLAEEPQQITGVCGHFTVIPDKNPNFDRSNPKDEQVIRGFQAYNKDGSYGTYDYADKNWEFKIQTVPGEIFVKPIITDDKEYSVVVKKGECAKLEIKIPEAILYSPSI